MSLFSSVFSSGDAESKTKQSFHPVTSAFSEQEAFGALEPKDTEWLCSGGFVTETQVFYSFMEDGMFVNCQVIYSSVGLWYPTIQFTCKIYKPDTKEQIWKSVNVSNWTSPPPASGAKTYDKRSCKTDQFSIIHNKAVDGTETYAITANPDKDVQINLTVTRQADGFKFGAGPKGGYSYFGNDLSKPEGYVVHRFWPRNKVDGMIILKGKANMVTGHGMFVHAIQGMRPNLIAASWNFADFQSDEMGGVSAIQMEFTSTEAYGKDGAGSGGVVTNIGSLVIGGKLVAVTGETRWPGEDPTEEKTHSSRADHIEPTLDPDTGYRQPKKITYAWSVSRGIQLAEGQAVGASLESDVGGPKDPRGLLEKVDVLAEIPYVIKKFVNYVAGTKPYIYQWLNPATLTFTGPTDLVPEGKAAIKGTLYNEATFISK